MADMKTAKRAYEDYRRECQKIEEARKEMEEIQKVLEQTEDIDEKLNIWKQIDERWKRSRCAESERDMIARLIVKYVFGEGEQ